ncbi:uncharacterized protein [Prorops nasuta]|uniref:uncharacterized protein n=1 Tax=Prorops nasuta TaxID=863751 RepID=UPI0034CF5408
MPPPKEKDWINISKDFWNLWNFPNCIGALDGKHIVIQAPPNSGSEYFNYKKTFSVVLLALVDAHCRFICVDIGAFSKNSDGGILAHSAMGKALENGNLNVPKDAPLPGITTYAPYVIVADEAFPLKRYLLRPYPGRQLDSDSKRIYNYRLSRARRTVENTFGIFTQKFRIYCRRIQAKLENVDHIIMATCILHNFIKYHDDSQLNQNYNSLNNETILQNMPARGGNSSNSAFNVREQFMHFFNSDVGSVPWQNDKI